MADSLGSAVLVAACGAFVAVLRNHAEIVRADDDRETPKAPARSFPVRSHSLGRCRHGGPPFGERMVKANPCQGLNGTRGRHSPAGAARRVGERGGPGGPRTGLPARDLTRGGSLL